MPDLSAGPKPADYTSLDKELAKHVVTQWSKARRRRIRLMVEDLVAGMPMASTFRHKRQQFPMTVAVIEEFKLSDQAERQTGRRPYWRKRLGLIIKDE